MERLSDRAIEIINELHTERLDYNSEYLPLIDAANKLGLYEDLGLEPSEVSVLCDMDRRAKMAEMLRTEEKYSLSIDRIKELVEANQDGRCVVSPCKVGDKLYTIRTIQDGSFTLEVYDSGEIRQISVNTDGTFFLVDYGHSLSANNFGKTVFKTREAAESALKAMKERENNEGTSGL